MTEREIFEKYKLSEYELNTKSKKKVYVENVINTIIECCRGEKKKPKEKYMGSEKVDDSRVWKSKMSKSNQKKETYL